MKATDNDAATAADAPAIVADSPATPPRKTFEEWKDMVEQAMPDEETMNKFYLAFGLTDAAPVIVDARFLLPAPLAAYLFIGRDTMSDYIEEALSVFLRGDFDDCNGRDCGVYEACRRLFGLEPGDAEKVRCQSAELIGWRKPGSADD